MGAVIALSGGVAIAAITTISRAATVDEGARRLDPGGVPVGDGAPLPPEAQLVDTRDPDVIVGNGTPTGCTSAAVVAAVARGGIITFDCGPDPVTITMQATAKVVNTSRVVVLDGGGRVTLSGGGERRILYMNTCDPVQTWTTSHCDDQDHPRLTIQRMRFTGGDSTGETRDGGGGGAVFARGGEVTVIDSHFVGNRCDASGPDVGGAALRILDQHGDRPVVVARSTFRDNVCSNGPALSSIGVSWRVHRSEFVGNRAIGVGANPARAGTPGGGNGGAIALDGNRFTLDLVDSVMRDNVANEGGGAIFFVSNDRTGELRIDGSTLDGNPSLGFETRGYPGIFFLGSGSPQVHRSTLR